MPCRREEIFVISKKGLCKIVENYNNSLISSSIYYSSSYIFNLTLHLFLR
jgi:hypothetical protein